MSLVSPALHKELTGLVQWHLVLAKHVPVVTGVHLNAFTVSDTVPMMELQQKSCVDATQQKILSPQIKPSTVDFDAQPRTFTPLLLFFFFAFFMTTSP